MDQPKIVRVNWVHDDWGRFGLATLRLADGSEIERGLEDHGVAASVLPYNPTERTALLVRQPRVAVLFADGPAEMIEVPAGLTGGEQPDVAARREALEEVGIQLRELEFIANAWSTPAVSTERVAMYLAAYSSSDRVAAGGGLAEEHEKVGVLEITLDDLTAMALDGRVTDMKTIASILALQVMHRELFV